jgi:hypothetical protein
VKNYAEKLIKKAKLFVTASPFLLTNFRVEFSMILFEK